MNQTTGTLDAPRTASLHDGTGDGRADNGHPDNGRADSRPTADRRPADIAVAMDRVRWGPVLAGVAAALATMTLLTVLGAAIGLSSADRGDSARAFGVGAGVWGLVSAIVSFLAGGAVAAYTAATPATGVRREFGRLVDDNGLLQGAMVWAVAVPLATYLLAGGVRDAAAAAGNAAQSRVQAEAQQRNVDPANTPTADAARDGMTEQNVERARDTGAKAAWGTFATLLVALGAASVGGLVGGKARRPVV